MSSPLISVGLPVRNGAAHIAQAIESLLNQTFDDLQVVVYDNASTDATAVIVEAIAARDDRVRLVRHERDIGGAKNFIHAAEQARAPFFCWAAHDDLRAPEFLQTLFDLLKQNPEAALACCAVRNIDPDGSPRDLRPETKSVRTTTGMTIAGRLGMYLREMPGTPFYGVFRTPALQQTLDVLRALDRLAGDGPAVLGIDMIFLAHFLRDHGLAYTPEPLLLFRRGGVSHNLGRYGSLREYLRQLRIFNRELRRCVAAPQCGLADPTGVRLVRWRGIIRWIGSRDMRRMTAHYLWHGIPGAMNLRSRIASLADPHLRRLRRRLRTLSAHSSIVLFGAGKHTRRRISALQRAVRGSGVIVAACDDRASELEPISAEVPVITIDQLRAAPPDVLLVSSDTYEAAMFRRAEALAPPSTHVWCLYDITLEASASTADVSAASTPVMKDAISANVSVELAAR